MKSKKAVPSKEEVFTNLQKTEDKLLNALAKMWDNAPDDPKLKAEILAALQKAVKLKEKTTKLVQKEQLQAKTS